jgi:hypothetical protein
MLEHSIALGRVWWWAQKWAQSRFCRAMSTRITRVSAGVDERTRHRRVTDASMSEFYRFDSTRPPDTNRAAIGVFGASGESSAGCGGSRFLGFHYRPRGFRPFPIPVPSINNDGHAQFHFERIASARLIRRRSRLYTPFRRFAWALDRRTLPPSLSDRFVEIRSGIAPIATQSEIANISRPRAFKGRPL